MPQQKNKGRKHIKQRNASDDDDDDRNNDDDDHDSSIS